MPSQRRTLEFFTALRLLQPSWAGTFLLCAGLNEAGRALALASLAAGAAALFLEGDEENLRTAAREGCSTFTVSTPDEALRALKNEVRQGHAITIALRGDPAARVEEMAARGVQPHYLATCGPMNTMNWRPFVERGSQSLAGFGLHPSSGATALESLVQEAAGTSWCIAESSVLTHRERRAQDASLLEALQGDEQLVPLSRQWLRAASVLFPRALERALWTRSNSTGSSPAS